MSAPSYEKIIDKGEWSSGICDCFSDCRLCVISCIPVVNALSLGQTYNVAFQKSGISEDPICGAIIPLAGWFFFPPLVCLQIFLLRQKFHDSPHNVAGDACSDCLCTVFCGWCVVQQCARHLQANPQNIKGDAYLFAPAPANSMESDGKKS